MENNLFAATMLGCGTNDLNGFFAKLDKYEDTVFFDDEDFSYQKIVKNVRYAWNGKFTIDTLNIVLDEMAVESALKQVESSEEFRLAIWDGFNGYYNIHDNAKEFWFDNVKQIQTFEEWEEFANLLGL
ncbi:hypothetical protein M5361_03495 [Ligilactobacillus agilis]|nr:hypothetical protein [Ligilactobacillus agilis]